MKLGPDVLVEIVAIVQRGLTEGEDVSQMLRDMELVGEDVGDNGDNGPSTYRHGMLRLSEDYKRSW